MLRSDPTESRRESRTEPDERIAHVIWAAHILSYLDKKRSHIEYQQLEEIPEDAELECDYVDAETERAQILGASSDSVRSKFLDCIAQLLSPCKGWDAVTASALREQEDFVEVDVARNDCFGTNTDQNSVQHEDDLEKVKHYCTKLEEFLSRNSKLSGVPSKSIMIVTNLAYSFAQYIRAHGDRLCQKKS